VVELDLGIRYELLSVLWFLSKMKSCLALWKHLWFGLLW